MRPFTPTHKITDDTEGTEILVMLVDGAAYTREEWDADGFADYERTDDGAWLCKGDAFAGTVEEITE